MNRLYGLIGFPLGHSFSARYFTEKFQRENLSGYEYRNFPLESIRELRRRKNFTLRQLSEKTGYTVSFLSQLERGIKNPSLDALRAIAQELNLTQREVKTRYEAACNVVRTRFLRYCTEKVEF